jgi:hypothetical protein
MTITADSGSPLEHVRQRQHDLMTELRDVEHWRRLVAARLDLAVAAVTALDEPAARLLPEAPVLPCGLKGIVGLPEGSGALPETAALVRLRDALRELDAYAAVLRETTDDATRALVELLDPAISVHRAD